MILKKVMLPPLVTFALSSGAAFAGLQTADPVIINANGFQGGIGYARNTSDSIQYIGCVDFGSAISCSARNSAGVTRRCFSVDQNNIDIVRSMSNGGQLFATFSQFGDCQLIGRHSSQDAPK